MKHAFLFVYLILALYSTALHGQDASPTPVVPTPTASPMAEPTVAPALTVATPPAPPTPPAAPTPKSIKIGTGSESFTLNFGSGDKDKKDDDPESHSIGEVVVPIVAISFVFGGPILIVALVLFYRMRKTRLLHQTIQNLVASGQPIPPELLISSGGKAIPSPGSDWRKGIILSAVGLGLIGYFLAEGDSWGVGLIPLAIGIGYLLTAKFAPRGRDASADKL